MGRALHGDSSTNEPHGSNKEVSNRQHEYGMHLGVGRREWGEGSGLIVVCQVIALHASVSVAVLPTSESVSCPDSREAKIMEVVATMLQNGEGGS